MTYRHICLKKMGGYQYAIGLHSNFRFGRMSEMLQEDRIWQSQNALNAGMICRIWRWPAQSAETQTRA